MDRKKRIRPDAEIIDLYWARNEEAIAATDYKYGGYLYTVAYNILHNPQDSEECRNDTYLRTWNTIPPNKPTKLQAYLTKIIRAISIDRYREQTRQKRIPYEMTVSLEDLAETLPSDRAGEQSSHELARCLSEYLASLSKRRRFIFVCRYYCVDPPDRIAAMLGITPSAVYKELKKIKDGLRVYLEKEGFRL